jgi:hypothetical protein
VVRPEGESLPIDPTKMVSGSGNSETTKGDVDVEMQHAIHDMPPVYMDSDGDVQVRLRDECKKCNGAFIIWILIGCTTVPRMVSYVQ